MLEEVKEVDPDTLTDEELVAKYGEPQEESEEVTESIEESPDTDTETAESDKTETTDTETETAEESTTEEANPELVLLEKLGLAGQFSNVEDALASIHHKDQELGRLRREPTEEQRERQTAPESVSQESDSQIEALRARFQEDPEGLILDMARTINSHQGTITSLRGDSLLANAIIEHPVIKERKAEIDQIIANDPILREANKLDPGWTARKARFELLATSPKPAVSATPKKTVIIPVSEATKASATTVSGNKSPKRTKASEVTDWDNMEDDEITDTIGFDEES